MTRHERGAPKGPNARATKELSSWTAELAAMEAGARIGGGTAADRLAWLADFAVADVARDRDRGWLGDVRAFLARSFQRKSVGYSVPTADDLPRLQAAVRRGVQDLVTEGTWQFRAPEHYGLSWMRRDGLKPVSEIRRSTSGDALSMFLHAVADLLAEVGPALRMCEAPG